MSHNAPIVNEVQEGDIERIAEMMYADMLDLGANPSLDALLELCASALKDAQSERGVLFLAARAEEGGAAIGMLLAHERLSVRFGGRALWVEELYVDPSGRMGGIGRALVTRALQLARARGLRGVDLEAYRMNTGASILYRSIGFDRLARERYALALDDLDWDA